VRRMSLLWPTETDVSESLMTLPNLSNVRTPKILTVSKVLMSFAEASSTVLRTFGNFRAALGATT